MWATGEVPTGADAGATLLEMLVVVAILAMVSGLTFADFRPALARYRLDAARSDVASAAAFARATALRTGEAQTLSVDADGAALGSGARRQVMPPGVRLAPASAEVQFSPDGTAEAGQRLTVSDGRATLALEIEPGSGLVAIARGAP